MDGDKSGQLQPEIVKPAYPALASPRPVQGYSCPSRTSMADLVNSYVQTKKKGDPVITQEYTLLANEIIWRHQGDDEAAAFFRYLRHALENQFALPFNEADSLADK